MWHRRSPKKTLLGSCVNLNGLWFFAPSRRVSTKPWLSLLSSHTLMREERSSSSRVITKYKETLKQNAETGNRALISAISWSWSSSTTQMSINCLCSSNTSLVISHMIWKTAGIHRHLQWIKRTNLECCSISSDPSFSKRRVLTMTLWKAIVFIPSAAILHMTMTPRPSCWVAVFWWCSLFVCLS